MVVNENIEEKRGVCTGRVCFYDLCAESCGLLVVVQSLSDNFSNATRCSLSIRTS